MTKNAGKARKAGKHHKCILDSYFSPPGTVVIYTKPGTLNIARREHKLIGSLTKSTVYFAGEPLNDHPYHI